MSKSVTTESNEGRESRETGGKRVAEDKGNENEEGVIDASSAATLSTLTTVSTAPSSWITKLRKLELRTELNDRFVKYEKKDNKSVLVELLHLCLRCEVLLSGNNFLNTDDFRRLIVPFLPNDAFVAIRLASKPWSRVADAFIDEGVKSGAMIVRGEEDLQLSDDWQERFEHATRVIFLLNITKVGECACRYAVNLVVVDIPEGVERIGEGAFCDCCSLTTVSFPATLASIGDEAFGWCASLENVDLLHTNLQELCDYVFHTCSELKSMTIPDSLQTLGSDVFCECFKLVPSSIDVVLYGIDVTPEVVAHLRSLQN